MFTFHRLRAAAIEQRIAAAATMNSSAPSLLTLRDPLDPTAPLPWGFAHDFRRSRIGHGGTAFARARLAFQRWPMFDLGWVRVAHLRAPIPTGQIVAVEAQTLGLWTLNLSQILDAVAAPPSSGFTWQVIRAWPALRMTCAASVLAMPICARRWRDGRKNRRRAGRSIQNDNNADWLRPAFRASNLHTDTTRQKRLQCRPRPRTGTEATLA
jgi:uncharacterized protein (UPF0548 family)